MHECEFSHNVLESQFSVGTLDFLVGRTNGDAENLVWIKDLCFLNTGVLVEVHQSKESDKEESKTDIVGGGESDHFVLHVSIDLSVAMLHHLCFP